MKIKDIILEDKEDTGYQSISNTKDHLDGHNTPKNDPKRMSTDADAAHPGEVFKARDVGGYDRVYHMNRLMMAMAKADGKSTKASDSAAETWYEKYNTIHPYTREEGKMVKSAMNTVPTDGKVASHDSKSHEPKEVHRQSPVPARKKNRYGV